MQWDYEAVYRDNSYRPDPQSRAGPAWVASNVGVANQYILPVFQSLGDQGWEMCGVETFAGAGSARFWFKRPRETG